MRTQRLAAMLEAGRLEDALAELARGPEDPALRGELLVRLARPDEAEAVLRPFVQTSEAGWWPLFLLGICADLKEEEVEADAWYRRAVQSSEGRLPCMPVRLPIPTLDRVIEDTLVGLPPEISDLLGDLTVLVERFPRVDQQPVKERDLLLLGVFEGLTLLERDFEHVPWPLPRVVVYQRPHELEFLTEDATCAELRATLLHEIAHFLGFEEGDMDRLGVA